MRIIVIFRYLFAWCIIIISIMLNSPKVSRPLLCFWHDTSSRYFLFHLSTMYHQTLNTTKTVPPTTPLPWGTRGISVDGDDPPKSNLLLLFYGELQLTMVNDMKERLRLSRRLWVSELNGILEKLMTIIVLEKMLFEKSIWLWVLFKKVNLL